MARAAAASDPRRRTAVTIASFSVDVFFLALHVLAASVWVGGTIILVFVVIPYARTLTGETRAEALREVGRGWRMFGWGAMVIAVVSGFQLAIADGAFDDAGSDFDTVLVVKIGAVGLLIAGAVVHDFVLGPKLARQIREGRSPTIRRPLIAVGWVTFALTVTVPVLGVVLGHLS
jgi:uncharacterized membrane protein